MIIIKDYIINNSLAIIKKSDLNYDDVKLEEIRYGLASIYTTYTKLIVITILAIILKIFKPYIMFLLLYNLIRTFSFGLHAKKSWQCWIASIIIFLITPFSASKITLSTTIKVIIEIFLIIEFFKNAPADTVKRPIISKKRRIFFKYISTIIAFSYSIISVITNNNLLSNTLLFALIVQAIIISPYTYKLFKLPYNNYKNYKY